MQEWKMSMNAYVAKIGNHGLATIERFIFFLLTLGTKMSTLSGLIFTTTQLRVKLIDLRVIIAASKLLKTAAHIQYKLNQTAFSQ